MLYRNSGKTLNAAFRAEEKADTMMAAEAPAAGEETEAAVTEVDTAAEGSAAEDAEAAADTMAGMPSMAFGSEYAIEENYAETETDAAAPALFMNAAGTEDSGAYGAASKAASADMAVYAAEEAYEEAAEEAAEDLTEMDAQEMMPLSTAMPTEPAAEPEEAQEVPADEPEKGFLQEAGAFLTDMGDFLLAALPYLAVLAVPAAVALVIRRRKRHSAG